MAPLLESPIAKHFRSIPTGKEKSKRTWVSGQWYDTVALAGGFVRSLLVTGFRKAGVNVPPNISSTYLDIDVYAGWSDEDAVVLNALAVARSFSGGDVEVWPRHNVMEFSAQCSLPDIQCVTKNITYDDTHGIINDIFDDFDLTCVQAAVTGKWWERDKGALYVTPLMAYSLLTGVCLHLTPSKLYHITDHLDEIVQKQPIVGGDPCWEYEDLTTFFHFRSSAKRIGKYLQKGYKILKRHFDYGSDVYCDDEMSMEPITFEDQEKMMKTLGIILSLISHSP
jgi:hypothetical protein